ncbi:MAG TPA: sigma-70 family RNA polymerase sigma factor [Chthonomonadaceae bacterium]|nr:sigma-70 family RNA polymerase sigma factor [Chthonomonadaceae bacterium]
MQEETSRILITGANGFVGRHLIAHLLDVVPDAWIYAAVHPETVRDSSKQADDHLDFDALILKYEKKIFNVIYRFLNDHEEATDLTQETFIAAFRHYDRFRGETKAFPWLYQIARTLCIHRFRRRRQQPTPQSNGQEDTEQRAKIIASVQAAHSAGAKNETGSSPDTPDWNDATAKGRVEEVKLDIEDTRMTAELVEFIRPHQIYHLAARASGADTDRNAVFAVNVEGTRHLLDAAANLNPFPRVLLAGTGYVYGNTDPARPAREEDPVGPLWRFGAYTDSKIEMESVAKGYRALAIIARAFSHTGPGQMPTYALPAFARQIARIERGLEPPAIRVGNLEAQRDLLDVRDVVRAYSALMQQGTPGEVYNVATGQPHRMRDTLDMLRALSSTPTEVEVDPERLRPADIACSTGDTLKMWGTTGWKPRIPLETTLRDTLDYWREQTERTFRS